MPDVISPESKLVNKVSVGTYFSTGNVLAKIFKNHLYLVREKELAMLIFVRKLTIVNSPFLAPN